MIKNLTKKFINEEDGAGLIEYLLIIAIVAVIAIILFKPLREWIANLFNNAMCKVNAAIGGSATATCNMVEVDDVDGADGW